MDQQLAAETTEALRQLRVAAVESDDDAEISALLHLISDPRGVLGQITVATDLAGDKLRTKGEIPQRAAARLERASALLNKAYTEVFEAVRLIDPPH